MVLLIVYICKETALQRKLFHGCRAAHKLYCFVSIFIFGNYKYICPRRETNKLIFGFFRFLSLRFFRFASFRFTCSISVIITTYKRIGERGRSGGGQTIFSDNATIYFSDIFMPYRPSRLRFLLHVFFIFGNQNPPTPTHANAQQHPLKPTKTH